MYFIVIECVSHHIRKLSKYSRRFSGTKYALLKIKVIHPQNLKGACNAPYFFPYNHHNICSVTKPKLLLPAQLKQKATVLETSVTN